MFLCSTIEILSKLHQANSASNSCGALNKNSKCKTVSHFVFMKLLKLYVLFEKQWNKRMREQGIALKRCFFIIIQLSTGQSDTPKKFALIFSTLKLTCTNASGLVFMWILSVFSHPCAHLKSLIDSCQWQLVTW